MAKSNVVRGVNNDIKKTYGVIRFRETQSCKRVLQNPKHHVNEKPVEVALSKFCLEMLMRPTTLWLWEIGYSLEQQELGKHFAQYGPVFRAIHIFNPATGEKKGYGFVDFVNEDTVAQACKGPGKGPYRWDLNFPGSYFQPVKQVHSERPAGFLWQIPAKNAEEGPHVYGGQVKHSTRDHF